MQQSKARLPSKGLSWASLGRHEHAPLPTGTDQAPHCFLTHGHTSGSKLQVLDPRSSHRQVLSGYTRCPRPDTRMTASLGSSSPVLCSSTQPHLPHRTFPDPLGPAARTTYITGVGTSYTTASLVQNKMQGPLFKF